MGNLGTIYHTPEINPDISVPDPHQDTYSKTILGFWLYLMNDCLLFATLFCTYAVLRNETFGGPSSKELFSLPLAFTETLILLFSSLTCGFAILSSLEKKPNLFKIIGWFLVTFLLGLTFLAIEFMEFKDLVHEGNSWTRSAFLSSFFTLVGTHGLHVFIGLIWMAVMMIQIYISGITTYIFRRLIVFSLFWHFLDVIWIFIFTFVYLMGVI